MKCPKCQFENPEGVKFCRCCGGHSAGHAYGHTLNLIKWAQQQAV